MYFQLKKGSNNRFFRKKQGYFGEKGVLTGQKIAEYLILLGNITKYVKIKEEEPGTKTYKVLVLVLKSVLYR